MKDAAVEMKGQVLTTIATLMTTAFGLIAALAWNEAIKAINKRPINVVKRKL